MDIKKIKRIFVPIIIFWVLLGGYSYETFGERNLFEYITYLLIGFYVCLDIKTKWKYLIVGFLVWNVVEESVIILGRDDFNLMNSIWIKVSLALILAMIIGLIKEKKTQPQ